jgi:hypothetical protein
MVKYVRALVRSMWAGGQWAGGQSVTGCQFCFGQACQAGCGCYCPRRNGLRHLARMAGIVLWRQGHAADLVGFDQGRRGLATVA